MMLTGDNNSDDSTKYRCH